MMPLSFRIKNYKSIVDTGTCYLASDLTILAGKNESGKTAILEALRDFGTGEIDADALPLGNDEQPEIIVSFSLDDLDYNELAEGLPSDIGHAGVLARISEHVEARGSLRLVFYSDRTRLDEDLTQGLDQFSLEDWSAGTLDDLLESLPDVITASIPTRSIQTAEDLTQIEVWSSQIQQQVPAIEPSDAAQLQAITEALSERISQEDAGNSLSEIVTDRLLELVPKFVFFSDFKNLLPDSVPVAEAHNSQPVVDFARIAGLDLEKLVGIESTQRRTILLSRTSASITGDFGNSWRQEDVVLEAIENRPDLCFYVAESGSTIKQTAGQRSQGFQWFLSFFLRLRASDAEKALVLIDEPGLYLHAKAQNDLLQVLEQLHKEDGHSIIFSTHSPYLIDVDRLDRVRLVIRKPNTSEGTKIQKSHAGADVDTLTPIVTAIGLDMSKQFANAGRQNVVLEGISDYYYFQALRELVGGNRLKDVSVIGCVGASKIPTVVSLLIGWGLDYVVVVDNDQAGRRVSKTIESMLLVPKDKIVTVSSNRDTCMEDLFTPDEFQQHVLDPVGYEATQVTKNSQRVKGLDKPLLAKRFADRARAGNVDNLSKETKQRFEELLRAVQWGLSEDDPKDE